MSRILTLILARSLDALIIAGVAWHLATADSWHPGWIFGGALAVLVPTFVAHTKRAVLACTASAWLTLVIARPAAADPFLTGVISSGLAGAALGLGMILAARRGRRLDGKPKLVSLSGYAQSGKDTAAAALVEDGWVRIAFADKLKAIAYASNPRVLLNSGLTMRLAELVDAAGWEAAKEHDDVRSYLQDLGLAARTHLGESVWLDAAFAEIPADKSVVITDARFPDELEAVRAAGGLLMRIDRPGVGPANGHVSEAAWNNAEFHAVITNKNTVETLHAATRYVAGHAGPRVRNPRARA